MSRSLRLSVLPITLARVAGTQRATVLVCVMTAALSLLGGCGKKKEKAPEVSHAAPASIKLTPRSNSVSVVSVGDILLGSASTPWLTTNGYDWPFARVQPLLGNADLVVGNLAAPITTARKKRATEDEYAYKVREASAPALKRAGFHALSIANDHVLDFGTAGLRETIAALSTNGIATFGAGDSEPHARRGWVCDFGTPRIGWLAYGEESKDAKGAAKGKRGGYAALVEKHVAEDIARMRPHADVVVVSLHWGDNYKDATEEERALGRRLIEAGADIVCGHHSHVAQGIEIHQGKPILYGLGNFVFGTRGRFPDGKQGYGLVSRWIFEGKALKWVLATPIGVNNERVNFQPVRVSPPEARAALEPLFQRFGTEVRWEADTAVIGFAPGWQAAALPALPWNPPSGQPGTNAPSSAALRASTGAPIE